MCRSLKNSHRKVESETRNPRRAWQGRTAGRKRTPGQTPEERKQEPEGKEEHWKESQALDECKEVEGYWKESQNLGEREEVEE